MTNPVSTRRRFLAAAVASFALRALPAQGSRGGYATRADVREFIDMLVERHGFDRARIERWLDAARYSSRVEQLMQPPIPFGQRNWFDYRARQLDPLRVDEGVAFWRSHAAALARAKDVFGVPPEIVVAIIGIETHYGRVTGNFRTIDVLATLAFDYPRRADYYRQELVEFMLLAREQRLDPLQVRGSYAGAIGLPQFMPRSIRSHALDFDGDGRIDLLGSAVDAIGSVANFLVAHGWQRKLPVLFDVDASESIVDALGRGILARVPWYEALAAGVAADLPIDLGTPVLVIDLPYVTPAGETARLYRAGTANFSAILHYNRSYFYATAVVELSRAIAAAN